MAGTCFYKQTKKKSHDLKINIFSGFTYVVLCWYFGLYVQMCTRKQQAKIKCVTMVSSVCLYLVHMEVFEVFQEHELLINEHH